ncbi:glycosyltransferase family 4 protein [Fibrella arboris]|uniref:glycosyltransferase family 4 protein n=1 Tax=Fibrella arboris TaxID=3242486 RepID=UPI0035201B6D
MPHHRAQLHDLIRNGFCAARLQADLFHITGDVHYLMLVLPPRRTILTIHDCISLQRLEQAGPRLKYWLLWLLYYYLPMRRAIYITTVSAKSKQELRRFVGAKLATKVRVIGNYYDPTLRHVPKPNLSDPPVLLQIGTADHKNLLRLAEALDGIPCKLVVVGQLRPYQHTFLTASSIDYEERVDLSDEQMRAAYEACDIVTFITTYEGFGMPILEAQAVGRAVLTADLSPMNEIAGAGACLVDPYDVAAIRKALARLMHDASYRDAVIAAGYANASHYTLDRVAVQYDALYAEVTAHD